MNFLELCRQVEIQSGTVDVSKLMTTVVDPTSRRLKVIGWVATAWTLIQNARMDWRFMRREYSATLGANIATYTGSDLSVARFSAWYRDQRDYRAHTIYDPTIGRSDTSELREISWNAWRSTYGRGVQTPERPVYYAISPDERICFGPTPDRGYQIEGEYYRQAQLLAADSDVPELPGQFHLIIVWRALMLLAAHDEAREQLGTASATYAEMLEKLEGSQLDRPKIAVGPPIA